MNFDRAAERVTDFTGSSKALGIAGGFVFLWVGSGPFFHFSDLWQSFINTPATIVTSLLVILIQNSTNRNERAMNQKIDELIRVTEKADDELIELEKGGL